MPNRQKALFITLFCAASSIALFHPPASDPEIDFSVPF